MITKPFFGATEKVLISSPESMEEKVTTDKHEIEKASSKHNKQKYTSAYSSPFLHEPLLSHIG